ANPLRNFSVPHWDTMLEMASKAYDVTGLGYLGADIVLDKTKGPLLLELNARPGLAIQIANRIGIRPLLKATLEADTEGLDALGRVELARKLYRSHVPEPI
ncbi:MAG TPA: alpha-L-glutamate ligase-like protein, partial [Hyphomonas atlantica]|nr:alpha-L-glutamate ligase-like protein [Hyphomonas atlantica]